MKMDEGLNTLNCDRKKECLSCKLITGIVLIGSGFYIGYNGYRCKGYNRIGMIGLGLTFGSLGVYRLLEKEKYEER